MKLAIMQPYVFPYIGYFQLINAVDTFVFYDDVTYIKNGWINRNRILLNGRDHYLTIPCKNASSYKLINEISFDQQSKNYRDLTKTLQQAYKKAPHFNQVFPLIENILKTQTGNISILATKSIIDLCQYLEINTQFKTSSVSFADTKGHERTDRIIAICKKENAHQYINAIGGRELYEKSYFHDKGIELNFIKSLPVIYRQFNDEFVAWLSIIDVLMFNSVIEVKAFLNLFSLD